MEERVVRAVISGRVQGVWYRGWTCDQAEALGLDGWVRNRRDGTVEAVFAGPAAAVEQMLAACRDGPRHALVTDIAVESWGRAVEPGFHQLPSA